jgi:deoxyadenosine/deoxycytidine kinase
MPKIVELIGPSGVGKTAVYKRLKNDWEPDYHWVPYDYLEHSRKKLLKGYIRKLFSRFIPLLFNKKESVETTRIVDEWKFIDQSNETFLGDKYKDLKSTVMDLIGEHCDKGFDGSDKRFITIYMIMWSIAHIETINSFKKDSRYCILKQGEGFISRIMHLNTPSFNKEALLQYLGVIPFPDVLIHLDVHPDEIIRRIKNRERVSTLHKGMDDKTLKEYTNKTIDFLNISIDEAKNAGVQVHKVDSTIQHVVETRDMIKEFLSK